MPGGRPTSYSDELANKICDLISTTNKGIHAICKGDDMPNPSTIFNWLRDNKEFLDKYARAKECQMEMLAEEILLISDDNSYDTIETDKGDFENKEWVNRSKLMVDTRKWLMSKLNPKKYGDKIQTEHSGSLAITPITGMEIK